MGKPLNDSELQISINLHVLRNTKNLTKNPETTKLLGFKKNIMVFDETSTKSVDDRKTNKVSPGEKFIFVKGKRLKVIKPNGTLASIKMKPASQVDVKSLHPKKGDNKSSTESQTPKEPQNNNRKFIKLNKTAARHFLEKKKEFKIVSYSPKNGNKTEDTKLILKKPLVDKSCQTEKPFVLLSEIWEDILSGDLDQDLVVGDDVNMGIKGKVSIEQPSNENNEVKKLFFNDLHRCLIQDSGNLPIHAAVIQGNLGAVKRQCVVLKACGKGINVINGNHLTPIQLAIIHNSPLDVFLVLLQFKADLSVLDAEGNNILHLAVERNRKDLVSLFLDNMMGHNLDLNQFNYDGFTPLMLCAFDMKRIDLAEVLIKKGAQLNLPDRKSGRTAIFHAAENHNTPMVSLLLDYSANTKIQNFFGTSIHDAMFELQDIPREIKYPILGCDVKIRQKKQNGNRVMLDQLLKPKKFEIVSTYKKIKPTDALSKD